MLLEELGIAYEREDYGRQFGNTLNDTYLRLNPNGKVPTLIDGDVTIWESNSVLRYLAQQSVLCRHAGGMQRNRSLDGLATRYARSRLSRDLQRNAKSARTAECAIRCKRQGAQRYARHF